MRKILWHFNSLCLLSLTSILKWMYKLDKWMQKLHTIWICINVIWSSMDQLFWEACHVEFIKLHLIYSVLHRGGYIFLLKLHSTAVTFPQSLAFFSVCLRTRTSTDFMWEHHASFVKLIILNSQICRFYQWPLTALEEQCGFHICHCCI